MRNELREQHYEFREDLVEAVIRDLVGPGRDDEPTEAEQLLTEEPFNRYIAGSLFPQMAETVEANVDEVDEDEDGRADPPVSLANRKYPSAMGMSFAVDTGLASQIVIDVTAGRYAGDEVDGNERWRRFPVSEAVPLDLSEPGDETIPVVDGLELFVRRRPANDAGVVAVTIALMNIRTFAWGDGERDEYSFFQVEMVARAENQSECFVDRTGLRGLTADEDSASYALLYRHNPTFATGHGCSADWTRNPGSARATEIRSTVAPSHELLLADNNPDVSSPWFSMRRLAENDRVEACAGLHEFVAGYVAWIKLRVEELEAIDGAHREAGEAHLRNCDIAARRMSRGIDLLESDDEVWLAFQLANRAMLVQRARSDWAKNGTTGEPDLSGDKHAWHAFQLGFVLLSLRSCADLKDEDRDVADLLWFPTGGGKTEAYLGLIAFVVFLRRLRGAASSDGGAGLTVIMRYTLRLLTLQQFERATLLMCACESIRRERDDLGGEEISICLWVGQAATPNSLGDARSSLDKLRKGEKLVEKNPMQLRSCPWCATAFSYRNYWVTDTRKRLVIACRNESCEFQKGLPAYVVDEDVYKYSPTLMIATVDKFASLPWSDKVGPLFGIDSEHSPPELIIQDELHLISGPLGTMVGLYETAIDMLCDNGGIGPKVIASTATIRRAEDQINKLYASDAFQFPPPGLDARDSYFAVEASKESKGCRRYLGLMAPATSHATLLVRSYAALLQFVDASSAPDEVKDPYWTLLGYFNSLRVLGGALLQVRDDVADRMQVLSELYASPLRDMDSPPIEMTSRQDSSEIPRNLELMGTALPDPDVLDVILATNMISVGVDVDRLGLMAVMGQPQSASEYIQATSRVGRRHPGLVVTLFNASKSRDRSHYEEFVAFHQSIYRQVDASSVTPFAARARDRGLHAVLIGMMRARYPEYRDNAGAADLARLDERAQDTIQVIVERVAEVHRRDDPSRREAEVAATRKALEQIVADWKERAEKTQGDLRFNHPSDPDKSLLIDAGKLPDKGTDAMPTMRSLRAVDGESNLFLVRG